MSRSRQLHFGAGLTWEHDGTKTTVGRNWPLCSSRRNCEYILRMNPEEVTCRVCKRILQIAGRLP